MYSMKHSVALVAGLATGIPVVLLVFIYVTYCCCKRKQKGEHLEEPRLWRRDVRSRSHDLFIPAYVPRFVKRFVQNSSKNSSETTSTQTSPVDDKTFFSEGSEPYRTAPDDINGTVDRDWPGGLGSLQVPTARRSSLLQPSTSSGESSESTYEHTPNKGISPKSPRTSACDSKSFEFVRPIPVKPLITITRAESLSKDDLNARLESTSYSADVEHVTQSHSDSQLGSSRKSRDMSSKSLESISQAANERRGSTDRGLASRSRSSSHSIQHENSKSEPYNKIPVNISSQVIRSRRGSKGKGSQPGKSYLGKINLSLQYKQTTCDLFVKIIQARDLPAKDLRRNTSSPYVRVYALPSRRHNHRTNVIQNNLNPTFNELFIISGLTLMEVQQLTLQILAIHNEVISRNVVIGEVMVPLYNLDLSCDETQIWRDIKPYHFQNVLGELHISVCHQPLSSRLSVTVLQARNLPKISSLNIGDPYVKIELFSSRSRVAKKKTRVKKKTVNPKFAQTFTFDLAADAILDMMTMTFTIMIQDSSGCHERIGQVVLSASSDGPEFGHWSQVIANPHCPIEQWHMIHE
ncbi:synaptotagmin-7-like [Actinia tenebrosa]|uniref:Synaptotagmin-7-like n=1 Tax=Actinia tenebrosa TaxID=6105 RepID=A0A6P8GXX1_ACTTE|nr:synaptotagmin-7-like [Actinia tenebrosa]